MNSKRKDGFRKRDMLKNCFCMFPKVKSVLHKKGRTPVYLNVYDLTPMNGYLYWAGVGVFHTGVEVHGLEYGFGAHDYPTSGVFEVEPRQCPGFKFRKSVYIGTTHLNSTEVRKFMEQVSLNYSGDSYHLIVNNCNHFCEDICHRLTGRRIPKWVNRLARIGSLCNCILPDGLKETTVGIDTDIQVYGTDRMRLRSPINCISPISPISLYQERELAISSLFLHSHVNNYPSTSQRRGKLK